MPLGERHSIMKLIIAIIQPDKLEAVQNALVSVDVFRLTVLEVRGFGRQLGFTEVYRGTQFKVNLLKKLQLEIAVNDDFVDPTVEAIIKAGRTEPDGEIGDGKVFILPLEEMCCAFAPESEGCRPSELGYRHGRARKSVTARDEEGPFDESPESGLLVKRAPACWEIVCQNRRITSNARVNCDFRVSLLYAGWNCDQS